MRTVTVEEHCLTPGLRAVLGSQIHPYYPVHRWPPTLEARLADIGEGRIAEMDASGIDVQVLSTAQPGLEHITADRAIPVARAFNERIAEAIAAHPGRFAGFAALLLLPGLSNGDMSLLLLARNTFPPWFLGIIGGAGALTAMVPSAIQILTAATLFIKNFCRPLFAPSLTDPQVATRAKAMVLVITVLALFFAIYSSSSLVSLLLLGYAGVTQFFPGVVLGLYSKRATRIGVFAGLVAGVAIVAALMLTKRDPYMGLNAGFIGLSANFAIVGLVSLLTPATSMQLDPLLLKSIQ